MSKQTVDNLKAAFTGESQARNFYTFWGWAARKEGWQKIAGIFEETAKNEKEHAEIILKLLNGINSNSENLKVAIDKETLNARTSIPSLKKSLGKKALPKQPTFLSMSDRLKNTAPPDSNGYWINWKNEPFWPRMSPLNGSFGNAAYCRWQNTAGEMPLIRPRKKLL